MSTGVEDLGKTGLENLVPGKFLETDVCVFIYRKGDYKEGW